MGELSDAINTWSQQIISEYLSYCKTNEKHIL